MKRTRLLIFITSILYLVTYAERPTHLSSKYIGDKMWNTRKMVSYNGTASLEIIDTIAYLKRNSEEKIDTFIYLDNHNSGFRYIRKKFFSWEHLWLSYDLSELQIGEPKEQNYFYKIISTKTFNICNKCRGTGVVLCSKCNGAGIIKPNKNGRIEEVFGICSYCQGSKSITHEPCEHCKGIGKIEVWNHMNQ